MESNNDKKEEGGVVTGYINTEANKEGPSNKSSNEGKV